MGKFKNFRNAVNEIKENVVDVFRNVDVDYEDEEFENSETEEKEKIESTRDDYRSNTVKNSNTDSEKISKTVLNSVSKTIPNSIEDTVVSDRVKDDYRNDAMNNEYSNVNDEKIPNYESKVRSKVKTKKNTSSNRCRDTVPNDKGCSICNTATCAHGNNTDIRDLRYNKQVLVSILTDASVSMRPYVDSIVNNAQRMKNAFLTSTERNCIQVSKVIFDENINVEPFTNVEDFKINKFEADGLNTRMYDAIANTRDRMYEYYDELDENDIKVKGMVIAIFTDGVDTKSKISLEKIKSIIYQMKNDTKRKVTILIYAFDRDTIKIAKEIGIDNIAENGSTEHQIRQFMDLVTDITIGMSKKS